MSGADLRPIRRGPAWRTASSAVMGLTAAVSKGFLCGLNDVQTVGLSQFLQVLDQRHGHPPQRGLLTVSNHISVVDDPLIWGVLPLKYGFYPASHRWGLGAHDICFKNKFTSTFFSLGQVLPTYRLQHSPHGGLFQPTMTHAISLLSSEQQPCVSPGHKDPTYNAISSENLGVVPTFANHHNAWVHVFPEGLVHQHPAYSLRYFKWGISRLILESDPAPDFIPIFIDGIKDIMPEDRKWPRWAPRIGAKVRIVFGDAVNTEELFGTHRAQWKRMVEHQQQILHRQLATGETTDALRNGSEAVQLRVEVAKLVRDEVERLREKLGYPEDKSSLALADTWSVEPNKSRHQSKVDGGLTHKS